MAEEMIIDYPWGKMDREYNTHYLAHHMMDVAACFEAICILPVYQKMLSRAAGRNITRYDIQRLSIMVFLHDVGKLRPSFQMKRYRKTEAKHASEGYGLLFQAARDYNHPLHKLLRDLGDNCGGNQVTEMFRHIFAHHGTPVDYSMVVWSNERGLTYDWKKHARDLDGFVRKWFPAAFREYRPLPDNEEFYHLINGLAALSDFIGSNRDFFPYTPGPVEGYGRMSRDHARKIIRHIGIHAKRFKVQGKDAKTLAGFETLNPAQDAMMTADLEENLMILESETGSGKTEAAIIRFALLFGAGKVNGLYFAVPTRAAAKQLHGRLTKAMKRIFGDVENLFPEPVLAVPGYMKVGEVTGERIAGFQTTWDDGRNDGTRWAGEHSSRYLAAAVAVGTVDQAMISGLRAKHAHMRGSALLKNLLVIDEVHASDEYMTNIIKHTLDNHTKLGGHALLMSATLGAVARSKWLNRQLPNFQDCVDQGYPAIWSKGTQDPLEITHTGFSKHVEMREMKIMGDAEEIARVMIEQARRGARVLLIRNTVDAAQAVLRSVIGQGGSDLLMKLNGVPTLHHSRFFVEDRERLDNVVEETLTTDEDRPPLGCIVIGTQTLEQSLDIDADILLTDLCPMDVLLQRIGRLQRKHTMPRPHGYESPMAWVLAPAKGLDYLIYEGFDNGLGAWTTQDGNINGIYYDLVGIEITRRKLTEWPVWRIPEMNRLLVESATHPDSKAHMLNSMDENRQAKWRNYDQTIYNKVVHERTAAEIVSLDRFSRMPEYYPEVAKTRMGDIGATLVLDDGTIGPFGEPIKTITLPEHLSHGILDKPAMQVDDYGDMLLLHVEKNTDQSSTIQTFEYTHMGLRKLSKK